MDHVDCVVAGAGVVGLAITRHLARSGLQVLCLEAAADLGAGTSGRGSGVLHAGLYYEPGSLKARLCVEGREMLYDFAANHDVPCRRIGKLVVATTETEVATLHAIAERAAINGVADLRPVASIEARRMEPALRCAAALHSPETGVIDASALLMALRVDAEEFGAVTAFQAPLVAVHRVRSAGFELEIGGAAPMRIGCRHLVNAAGHGAVSLARHIEGLDADRVPRAFMAKGNYFRLEGDVPFSRLIYPVPVPGGMGTHLTIDPHGLCRLGPDVEWVDRLDAVVDPSREAAFAADVRRWWPDLPDGSLVPDRAGVRPKIAGPGEPEQDFRIEGEASHGIAGLVNLFGIESPGLTASLAIASHVSRLLAA